MACVSSESLCVCVCVKEKGGGGERETEKEREEVHVSRCGYEVIEQPRLSVLAFHLV